MLEGVVVSAIAGGSDPHKGGDLPRLYFLCSNFLEGDVYFLPDKLITYGYNPIERIISDSLVASGVTTASFNISFLCSRRSK